MKQIPVIALLLAAMPLAAFGQEPVPEAMRPASVGDAYVPSLGDIMGATQLRHIKLWNAGRLKNWELAAYELGQIEDSFNTAARLYRNIPIENIEMIGKPLAALDGAIKAKDGARFAKGFSDLTTTCDACHEVAHVGFITVQVPTASPFTDQSFKPRQK